MAKAKATRFGTRAFCAAWQTHGEKAKNWDEFVSLMRGAAGDPDYPEARIKSRIEGFVKDLKKAGYVVPRYPKERKSAAVAAAASLGWKKKDK